MGHGVIDNSANLVYEFQSGALNESFADIFGVMVDREDWTLGEDVVNPTVFTSGSLRNLKNPNNNLTPRDVSTGWQPKHMSEYLELPIGADNGGVHINSGIPNHAFYLFATTDGIGKERAEQVYYKALTSHFLMANSEFIDCRNAIIIAAQQLYGTSAANAAAAAFDQVGIYDASHNNQNAVVFKDLRIDATYEHISVLVEISGDENLNSVLVIEYRPKGTDTYLIGAKTMRAHPSMVVAGKPLNINHHAGSIMFLDPNTTYDLRLSLLDSNGGNIDGTIEVTTKAEVSSNTGTAYYVVPGNGGGTGSSSNPYRGLQAAADNARPGSRFIVRPGIYKEFHINTSGTASKPIIFKSEYFNEAIINGNNTNRGIVNIGNFDTVTEHIVVEGFGIKNGAWGINAENTAFLTIRNNLVTNVDIGLIIEEKKA